MRCSVGVALHLLLQIYSISAVTEDIPDEDPYNMVESRCKAKCVFKFIAPPYIEGPEGACDADEDCSECLQLCEVLSPSYYRWNFLCHKKVTCGTGCKTACRTVKRYRQKEIPDMRRHWVWQAPTRAEMALDEEDQALFLIEWLAPSKVGKRNHTVTEDPVYNVLWSDASRHKAHWKHLMTVIDPYAEIYPDETAPDVYVRVQAILTVGVVGVFQQRITFPATPTSETVAERREQTTQHATREVATPSYRITHQGSTHDSPNTGYVSPPQDTTEGTTHTATETMLFDHSHGGTMEMSPVYHYSSDNRSLPVAIGVAVGAGILAFATIAIFLWWEIKGRQMCMRGIGRERTASASTVFASRVSLALAGFHVKDRTNKRRSFNSDYRSVATGDSGFFGYCSPISHPVHQDRSISVMDLPRTSSRALKSSVSMGSLSASNTLTSVSGIGLARKVDCSRDSGSGVWV